MPNIIKKVAIICTLLVFPFVSAQAQTTDTTTNINTDTTSTSTVDSTNTNTNNNNNNTTYTGTNNNNNTSIISNTSNNNNTNNTTLDSNNTNNTSYTGWNNSTSNNTNTNNNNNNSNINQSINSTSDNTSNNTNTNNSTSKSDVNTNNKNENINRNVSETTINSPPPSAVAPSIGSSYSQDLCTTGISGAVQTQIFGMSAGKAVRDENCERIKLSKTLYDMGMKVASVSLMCQDERVWNAMMMAGTPCPFEGRIGDEALVAWENNPDRLPDGIARPAQTTLEDNKNISYKVWKKEDFCEKYPDEKTCK